MPRFVFLDGVLTEVPYARDLPRQPSRFPSIQSDLAPYKSPLGTGWIDGRRARREDLARGGCREVDPSEYRPVAWNPENAARYGLPYEPPPPTPEHVRRWRDGKLAQRDPVAQQPATPEMIEREVAEYRSQKAK